MGITGRNILLISPEPWVGLHMSKHHLAEALAASGNTVSFLGPPVKEPGLRLEGGDPLRVVHYHHWFPGINRMPRWIHRWYYDRLIARIERMTGRPFDLLWCFDTSRLQEFPHDRRTHLLHLVDLDILYTGHGLVRTADLVVATTDPIVRKVHRVAPGIPAYNVGHALDPRWLEDANVVHEPKGRPPRLVVYAGQFYNTYMDWSVLLRIAMEHPALHFRFIGPLDPGYPDPAFQRIRSLGNVEFTGLVAKERLVPMVREADVLLFCFKQEALEQCANPHKVLEYLSTGNVTIGTRTLEYDHHPGVLEMAVDTDALPAHFRSCIDRFAELDARPPRERRIAFARERTTGALLDRIGALLAAANTRR